MKGDFSIGLTELLAYLVPGLLVCAAVVPELDPKLRSQDLTATQLALLLIAAYLIGHALAVISRTVVWLRSKVQHREIRERRYSFYPALSSILKARLAPKYIIPDAKEKLSRSEEYSAALAIVIDHCPGSAATVQRLRALVLFSRNAVVSLLIIATTFAHSPLVALTPASLAVLLFIRYIDVESDLEATVFMASYAYLRCGKVESGG